MPSTSRCLRSSEQVARISPAPPSLSPSSFPSLCPPSFPARPLAVISRGPEVGGASISHRAPANGGNKHLSSERCRCPLGDGTFARIGDVAEECPTFRKRGALIRGGDQTTSGALHFKKNFVLLFLLATYAVLSVYVVHHPCAPSSGRQPIVFFFFFSLSRVLSVSFLMHFDGAPRVAPSSRRALS